MGHWEIKPHHSKMGRISGNQWMWVASFFLFMLCVAIAVATAAPYNWDDKNYVEAVRRNRELQALVPDAKALGEHQRAVSNTQNIKETSRYIVVPQYGQHDVFTIESPARGASLAATDAGLDAILRQVNEKDKLDRGDRSWDGDGGLIEWNESKRQCLKSCLFNACRPRCPPKRDEKGHDRVDEPCHRECIMDCVYSSSCTDMPSDLGRADSNETEKKEGSL